MSCIYAQETITSNAYRLYNSPAFKASQPLSAYIPEMIKTLNDLTDHLAKLEQNPYDSSIDYQLTLDVINIKKTIQSLSGKIDDLQNQLDIINQKLDERNNQTK